MRRLLILAPCALLALLSSAQTLDPSVPPLIGVYMDFDHVPETVSFEAMKRAVESILKPSGIQLAWRFTSANRGTETFANFAVLKFHGQCRADAPRSPSDFGTLGETRTLASTSVSAGRVLPFSKVECDQVRKALNFVRPGSGALQRDQALGLALGRVVAHELYHILARTVSHASEGLAQRSQLLRDLVSVRELNFDQGASTSIRAAVPGGK